MADLSQWNLKTAYDQGLPLPDLPELQLVQYLRLYLQSENLSHALVLTPEHTIGLRFIKAYWQCKATIDYSPSVLFFLARQRKRSVTLTKLAGLLQQWLGPELQVTSQLLLWQTVAIAPALCTTLGNSRFALGINTTLGRAVSGLCPILLLNIGLPYQTDATLRQHILAESQCLLETTLGRNEQWRIRVFCLNPPVLQLGASEACLSASRLF